MRLAYAATLATLALLLAACSDDGDEPGDPMATWTPSGTVETPSASPSAVATPTEPPLPDAATKATEAGARAFITYYWDLINYAQLTGDVEALSSLSSSTCDGCWGAVGAITEIYDGGSAVGGEYTVAIDRVVELASNRQNFYGFEVAVSVRNAEQVIHRPDGTREISKSKTSRFLAYLLWTEDAWRTDVLEPR
ncbi:DUF6318 family protein [Nocardioides caeni]